MEHEGAEPGGSHDDLLAWMVGPRVDPEEDAAFLRYTNDLTQAFWPWFGLVIAASALLWWPLDRVVFWYDARTIAAMSAFRGRIALIDVLLALALPRVAIARAHPHLFATGAALANIAMAGWLLAEAGGGTPGFLAYGFILPLFSVLLLVPLRARVGVTFAIAGVLYASWIAHPAASWDTPGVSAALSYLVFASGLSVFIGQLLYVQMKASFHLGRSVERQRGEVATLAGHLEQRVELQTREIRALSERARHVRAEQRREIARDLHDGVGQELTSLRLLVGLQARLAGRQQAAEEGFQELDEQVRRIQESLRRVLDALKPELLEDAALLEALQALVDEMERRSGLTCRLEAVDAARILPGAVNLALFRIAQEAMTNAVRHARAKRVDVRLACETGRVTLRVRDDGRGFDPIHAVGIGTRSIRERAEDLGGTVRWNIDGGTTLEVVLPLREVP